MTTLPTDKNSYSLTDKAIRQTQCKASFGRSSATLDIRIKGLASELVELAAKYREGQVVRLTDVKTKWPDFANLNPATYQVYGSVRQSEVTAEEGGNQGAYGTYVLRISFPFKTRVVLSAGDEPDEEKIVTWQERSCQYQYPLERYAGKIDAQHTESSYGDAGKLETWKNENGTDQALYGEFKIKVDGEEEALKDRTLDIAKKIFAGIQSVERYYPEITRVTEYRYIEGDDEEVEKSIIDHIDETPDLAKIDDTPDSVWAGKFPNTSWLKVGYDVQTAASQFEGYWNATVTETWRGVDKTDNSSGWDKNLYGSEAADRWKFYGVTSPQANNANNNNNQGG